MSALERIAISLEVMAGLERPLSGPREDESAILYTNDEEEVEKELRREAYRQRVGKELPPGEDVPRPAGLGWTRNRQGEIAFPPTYQFRAPEEGDSEES